MVNAIRSALGLVKHLLPVSTGGPLPLSPKLPDVPSFLDDLLSMLGASPQTPPVSPAKPESAGSSADGSVDPEKSDVAPEGKPPRRDEPNVLEDELRREIERRVANLPPEAAAARLEALREAIRQLEHRLRSTAEPKGGDSADVAKQMLQALQMIRKQAAAPQAPAASAVPAAPALPEGVLPPPAAVEPPPALAVQTPVVPEGTAEGTNPSVQAPVLPPLDLPPVDPFVLPPPAPTEGASVQAPRLVAAPVAPPVPGGSAPPPPESSLRGVSGARILESVPAVPRSRTVPGANRGEFIDRMVKAARLTQTRGMARIKIILHPPHLGELKVDLTLRQQVLHATLQAEHPAAKEILQSHLPALKEALEGQGIQVGEFQVDVDQAFARTAGDREETADRPRSAEAHPNPEDAPADDADRIRSVAAQVIDVIA